MDLTFLGIGIGGWALGLVSRQIVRWWIGHKDCIEEYLQTIDDKIAEAIKAKTGYEAPERFHAIWDKAVHDGVSFADNFARNGAFWRNVMRAIMSKDPAKAAALLDEVKKIDWKKYLMDQLSPDLKEIVNGEKNTVALNVARAAVAKSEAIAAKDLPKAISLAAKANKIDAVHDGELMSAEMAAKMADHHAAQLPAASLGRTADMQAEIERLRARLKAVGEA